MAVRVAVSLGDPSGIGPEVSARAAAALDRALGSDWRTVLRSRGAGSWRLRDYTPA